MKQPAKGLKVSGSLRRTYLYHRSSPPADPQPAQKSRTLPGLIDLVALIVALVALVLSFLAWTAPYPADPRNIPHHGAPGAPVSLSSDAVVSEFFDFLEAEQEGRIYLNVAIPMERAEHYKLRLPAANEPYSDSFILESTFLSKLLQIEKANDEGRRGIYFAHGVYNLNGYFANNGIVDISTGVAVYRITPLTDLEALSP